MITWVQLATAFMKLSSAIIRYAQDRHLIKAGELQALNDAQKELQNRVKLASNAVLHVRSNPQYRDRLRKRYDDSQ